MPWLKKIPGNVILIVSYVLKYEIINDLGWTLAVRQRDFIRGNDKLEKLVFVRRLSRHGEITQSDKR